jgi:hypothetical protein
MIKKIILITITILLLLIALDYFFDRFTLQSPILIKFQSPIAPRSSETKSTIRKNAHNLTKKAGVRVVSTNDKLGACVNGQKCSLNAQEEGGKKEQKIQPFRKYLTDIGARNREIALSHLREKGFSEDEITAFDNIFKKESGYQANAVNEIGCVGIPQDCLGRMKCSLENTEEAVKCQVDWAIQYVKNRYGNGISAWQHHTIANYY